MAKAKLRHLALFARDPEALAQFYIETLGMEIVAGSEGSAARYVTDGYFTLAILPHRLAGSAPRGLNHFGFVVENVAETAARMSEFDVEQPAQRPGDRPFAEFRAVDPEGNWFDLSAHGYDAVETGDERAKLNAG